MSLYGGIKFATSTAGDEGSAGPSGSSSGSGSAPNRDSGSSTSGGTINKATGEWSAALKFAPRINKPKPAAKSGFNPISTTSMTSVSNSTSISSPASGSAGNTPTPALDKPDIDIVRMAEPVLKPTISSAAVTSGEPVEEEVVLGPDGLPLARAPAMTLNAARIQKGMGGKRDREGGDGQKKRKKKKKRLFQPLMPTFDPDEQYDPNRPNDLGEYQQYRKRQREERRAKLLEEKRRRAQGLSSDESSYYTDSEEEAPRRDAPKMFAPPKMYSPPKSSAALPPSRSYPPPSSLAAPPPAAQNISGNDAYARRAALSQQPSSGDDAYARRLALSQQASSGDDAYAKRAALSQQPSSGDDAYARRVALSQGQGQGQGQAYAPPPVAGSGFVSPSGTPNFPPSFAPTSQAVEPTSSNRSLRSSYPQSQPSQASLGGSDIPGFSAPPSVPSTEAAKGPEDFAKMLEERKKAAEAIAAKFKALAGAGTGASQAGPSSVPAAAPQPLVEEDTAGGTFAEKMMRKWGHKEGQGLGVHGTGIVHALAAEHVQAAPKPGENLSKRQLAKQKAAAANAKNRKWVQNATSRGRIVNANEDSKMADERGRLGDASRIICLVGLVDGVDDVDEEMSDEIGEECSKFGIVERVVLHMVEPPPLEPSECLRVFIVFSGMAGAWRATKELDGRFFGGKKIRATYFDETKFDSGERDGPIV